MKEKVRERAFIGFSCCCRCRSLDDVNRYLLFAWLVQETLFIVLAVRVILVLGMSAGFIMDLFHSFRWKGLLNLDENR